MFWIFIALALISLHGFVVSFYFTYYKMTPKSTGTQMTIFIAMGIMYAVILLLLLALGLFIHP